MIAPVPLLILLGAVLTLFIVQQLLLRMHPTPQPKTPTASTDAPDTPKPMPKLIPKPRRRGRPLSKGLSVAGLDERGIEQMQKLIREADIEALATFLAFNRPGVIELDAYIAQHRNDAKRIATDSQTPLAVPADIFPDALSQTEWEHVLNFPAKTQRRITRQFMSRFGGHAFRIPFQLYTQRDKQVALHIPPSNKDRASFETLAESGIARQGRHIPLPQRLTVLKMSQLRQMAKDLHIGRKFKRKHEAAEQLAAVPGAAVLLSMQYVVDDLFMLTPIEEDPQHIQQEWDYLIAYAKLLCASPSHLNP
ncbi:MAG: hypothetical protein GXP17_01635 [Gammaproteobacteria bacterium]|nr:hypothetical protein [Gammaproteobacteria bacterium]